MPTELSDFDLHGISIALSVAMGHNDYPSMLERFKYIEEKVEKMIEERNNVGDEDYRY